MAPAKNDAAVEKGALDRLDSDAPVKVKDETPYGVRYIQATVAAFRTWDRTLLFVSLFLVACECVHRDVH